MQNRNIGAWGDDEAVAWDLIIPKSRTVQEIEFLEWTFDRFADRKVKDILDLGCGTARLAIELGSRGYRVTGVDKSESMIKRGRSNARERGVNISLYTSPLEDLSVSGNFDAAYSVFGVVSYVLSEDELARLFNQLGTVVRKGGLLIIDVFNFASLFKTWKDVTKNTEHGKGWRIERTESHRVDEINMLMYHEENTRMTLNGKTKHWKETHLFRMWSFPELRNQLLSHGFSHIRLFCEMKARSPEVATAAQRLVIVATKT